PSACPGYSQIAVCRFPETADRSQNRCSSDHKAAPQTSLQINPPTVPANAGTGSFDAPAPCPGSDTSCPFAPAQSPPPTNRPSHCFETTADAAATRCPAQSSDKPSRSPTHGASRFLPANWAGAHAKTHPVATDPTAGSPPSTRPTAGAVATQIDPVAPAPRNPPRARAGRDPPDTRPTPGSVVGRCQTPR